MSSWWRWVCKPLSSWRRQESAEGPARPLREVVLYTRHGCHLCEEALEVLQQVRRRADFALAVVDIDGQEQLERLYGLEVPVVLVDGQVRFRGRVNAVLLRRLLRAAAGGG